MGKGRRQSDRHGYLVIDKPAGWTSHDVVARVRHIVDERRVGHAGTLDPAATGVLPVAVGLATRTVQYLSESTKSYRATIRFGITTDTADGDGAVTATVDPSGLTQETIDLALESFRGEILQRPPMHSAIKVDGKRLYELARKGVEVEVRPRLVTINDLSVIDWSPPDLRVEVECSKGTYIRSLARDIGDEVGTGAHLSHLIRTRVGPFTMDDALTLETLERYLDEFGWDHVAYPPDYVLHDFPSAVLGPDQVRDWRNGKPVAFDGLEGVNGTIRAYDALGLWLGTGVLDSQAQVIRPSKVIPSE